MIHVVKHLGDRMPFDVTMKREKSNTKTRTRKKNILNLSITETKRTESDQAIVSNKKQTTSATG